MLVTPNSWTPAVRLPSDVLDPKRQRVPVLVLHLGIVLDWNLVGVESGAVKHGQTFEI